MNIKIVPRKFIHSIARPAPLHKFIDLYVRVDAGHKSFNPPASPLWALNIATTDLDVNVGILIISNLNTIYSLLTNHPEMKKEGREMYYADDALRSHSVTVN